MSPLERSLGSKSLNSPSETKEPLHFPAAGLLGAPFTAVNGAALLVTIVLGTWATVYADLFPNSTLGQKRLSLAAAWLVSVALVLLVLGHNEKAPAASPLQRIVWGVRLLSRNAAYAFLIFFMAAASGWCIYGRATGNQETGGLLQKLVESAHRSERLAKEARHSAQLSARVAVQTDVKAELILQKATSIQKSLERPLTARERLANEGFTWDDRTFTQALMNGDGHAVALFLDGGWNVLSPAPQG